MEIAFKFADNKEDAYQVRRRVFIDEQGFQDEFDAIDEDARMIHLTVYCDGALAGCARLFPSAIEPKIDGEEGSGCSAGSRSFLSIANSDWAGRSCKPPKKRRRAMERAVQCFMRSVALRRSMRRADMKRSVRSSSRSTSNTSGWARTLFD